MAGALSRCKSAHPKSATSPLGAIAASARDDEVGLFGDGVDAAAIWGSPTFADAELAALASQHGSACAIAQRYADIGADILANMSGSFALALISKRRGEVLLATDRLGTRPMFYGIANGALVFGTSIDAIVAFPGQDWRVDPQSIYHYLYFHMVPGPRTIYHDLRRLLPGESLTWRNGAIRLHSYWQLRFVEDDERPFAALKEEFLGLLHASVAAAAGGRRVGAFLSGGTDSSTITGVLGKISAQPPETYSIGFSEAGYDEMRYARLAARQFGASHHARYITPQDVVEAIPLVVGAHDQPFGNSSAVPTYYCAKFARDDGIETMLGGDGGDELFGGNERYGKQYLYSLYSDQPRVLRKGVIEPILFGLPQALPLVGKMQRYVRHASQPMPARYDNYNLVERLGAEAIFTAAFLAGVDRSAPACEMNDVYWGQRSDCMINRMLGFDLRYTLADNDLPKVLQSCELAGVGARFPMLDDGLVSFAARLAPRLKVKGTRLRYFFKEALRGFLPNEIIAKPKHGFGLPFGPWLRRHDGLREIAFDSLAGLKRRGIVRPQFIDELCSRHVEAHAHYYGTMVWLLMILEQWLIRRERILGTAPKLENVA